MNNEDYLDSLLKAAVAEDNPNSAINKVRKIESEMPKEPPIEETAEAALSPLIHEPQNHCICVGFAALVCIDAQELRRIDADAVRVTHLKMQMRAG